MDTEQLAVLLFEARTYRDFLRTYFQEEKVTNPRISYRALADRSGFSSKSYIRDIQIGKKRLTTRSLPKLANGLRMTEELKKYFTLLVSLEEQEVNIAGLGENEIRNRMQKIRNRFEAKRNKQGDLSQFYCSSHWLEVYASMGSTSEGASVAEIINRSKLGKPQVEPILAEMVQQQVAERKKDRFYPKNAHLIFDKLGGDAFFQRHYIDSVKNLQSEASAAFHSDDRLFLNSTFSASTKSLKKFRQELRELVLRFIDTAEDSSGDSLVKLTIGMIPNHQPLATKKVSHV